MYVVSFQGVVCFCRFNVILIAPESLDKACDVPQKRSHDLPDGCVRYNAAPFQDMHVPGMPVIMQHQSEAACVASSHAGSTIDLEWIADSGASRSLGSVKALAKQGL